MTKTTFDMAGVIMTLLTVANCPLKQAITGKISFDDRLKSSVLEDVVINTLPLTGDQVQLGVVNVNIYVPDKPIGLGQTTANQTRLAQLTALALQTLAEGYGLNYSFYYENQSVFDEPETASHYTNIRITFRYDPD